MSDQYTQDLFQLILNDFKPPRGVKPSMKLAHDFLNSWIERQKRILSQQFEGLREKESNFMVENQRCQIAKDELMSLEKSNQNLLKKVETMKERRLELVNEKKSMEEEYIYVPKSKQRMPGGKSEIKSHTNEFEEVGEKSFSEESLGMLEDYSDDFQEDVADTSIGSFQWPENRQEESKTKTDFEQSDQVSFLGENLNVEPISQSFGLESPTQAEQAEPTDVDIESEELPENWPIFAEPIRELITDQPYWQPGEYDSPNIEFSPEPQIIEFSPERFSPEPLMDFSPEPPLMDFSPEPPLIEFSPEYPVSRQKAYKYADERTPQMTTSVTGRSRRGVPLATPTSVFQRGQKRIKDLFRHGYESPAPEWGTGTYHDGRSYGEDDFEQTQDERNDISIEWEEGVSPDNIPAARRHQPRMNTQYPIFQPNFSAMFQFLDDEDYEDDES